MIDSKQAKAKGVKVVVRDETLANSAAMTIAQLKQLLPNVINSDNQLDARALADVLDIANTTSNNQGYELTFAGKGIARAKADSPTNMELKTELVQSKNFNETDNVVIRGDNIDVLKILYQNYHNKIKMIYIDPPYNTQSDNFVYNDNFKQNEEKLIEHFGMNEETSNFLHNVYGTRSHSGWLSFMYPRLKLARDLLADEGVIFISIDDNEQANLKIICDEIFGGDNFVNAIIWQRASGGGNAKGIVTGHDYVFVYQKHKDPIIDFRGEQVGERFSKDKTIIKDGKTFFIDDDVVRKVFGPYPKGTERRCYYEELSEYKSASKISEINEKIACGKYFLIKQENGMHFIAQLIEKGARKKLYSIIQGVLNDEGINDMNKLELSFPYPKPVRFIQKLLCSCCDKDSIILDFFAGSGTTGEAVMQINAEDDGKRKFVLVQWDETIDKNKSAEEHKFCTDNNLDPVISSITIERLNRAGEKIKEEYIAKNSEMHGHPPPPPRFWL